MRAHNTSDAMGSRSRVAEFYRLRSTTKLTECQMGSVVVFFWNEEHTSLTSLQANRIVERR